jgi:hypothetical protein
LSCATSHTSSRKYGSQLHHDKHMHAHVTRAFLASHTASMCASPSSASLSSSSPKSSLTALI